ncbi:MFS general substrate transporter [Coemansia reversa NRRL 1564]|uniref:MFS general substrate transporter n=1 Tax=Coemansia reversa (strain ATCC 12441 / NRRL 1564) TaxID=763665 RepID=A0A2G5B6G7_COERN|nr:MFS general substrate transporter [Coemansia reversa NRRL 1564]|eukprot:PIA14616.1 MFS general substrate transporter [Coemansia reversa NRRL 1564]
MTHASRTRNTENARDPKKETPLPWGQLSALLAVRLAEPVTYTLILPFVYEMVKNFEVVKSPKEVSIYAGILLMSYSFCEAATTIHWGTLSDRIGRRPTILISLIGDLATFVLFGLSKSFKWALVTRSLNGCFAGNSAVARSAIAEMADDSNRPRMMALLPLIWNVGAAGGAAIGGLLSDPTNKYPQIFGNFKVFRIFPYLLPCMVGSVATAVGLIAGLLKLKETLVTDQPISESEIIDEGELTEISPLVTGSQFGETKPNQESILSLLTPISKRVLLTNALMCLVIAMSDQVYPIFAATEPSDGGLGFGTRGVGFSLIVSGIAVIYLQLSAYPQLEKNYGALQCYQAGLKIMTPTFIFFQPETWLNYAGFEYCILWISLIILLLVRITGNVLAFTSVNLLVANVTPSKSKLGAMNGLQQMCITCVRIIGPLLSGSLWSWSIKHTMPYPFNSHLAWVTCGLLMLLSWQVSLRLPSSVNIFAPGQSR